MKLMKSNSYYAGYENARNGGNAGWTGTASALDEYAEGMRDFHADQRLKDAVLEQDLNECIGQCNTKRQFESLAREPENGSSWNGEGLPPIGMRVEYTCKRFSDHSPAILPEYWYAGTIIAYYEGFVWTSDNGIRPLENTIFRPIRTEAERKREEAIKKIAEMGFFSYDEDLTSAAFLFDAIAAGKIPHINLEA